MGCYEEHSSLFGKVSCEESGGQVRAADTGEDAITVQPWDPSRALKRLDEREISLSRGFLRSRPERWFPGFTVHWITFAHALGCEARIVEVKTALASPSGFDTVFEGTIDSEPFTLMLDESSARTLCEEVNPGGDSASQEVVLEYLARRFIASLAQSWTGPESSKIEFNGLRDAESPTRAYGSIKVTVLLNTSHATLWLTFGQKFIESLDGLWRRQVQSAAKQPPSNTAVLELVQLGVPPQMLSEYLKRNTVIDLEIRASDALTVRLGAKPWISAKLCESQGKFACEVQPGPVTVFTVAEGMTRLSIELGRFSIDAAQVAECSQGGAVLTTGIPIGDTVKLVINDEPVAEATLGVFEGRFAITIA